MHILIIPSWYPSSYNHLLGIFFKEQAEALSHFEHKVGVIAIQGVGIKQIVEHKKIDFSNKTYIENNVLTYRKQFFDIKFKSFLDKYKIYYFKKNFKQYIKENGLPELIHLHSFFNGEMAIWIKEEYNIPYVVTEHVSSIENNGLDTKLFSIAKKTYLNSKYNISVSEKLSSFLSSKFNTNFNYLPNIVNTDFFTVKKGSNKESFNFINIAYLTKNKNQEMLIYSFYDAFKNKKNVKLVIVGHGSQFETLLKLIKKLDIENQVTLFGTATRKEVKELLHQSDAFVLSSKYETFGVVLIEALSCGLPVVSTKCGGPESIIKDEKLGLLCNVDRNSLSKGLEKIHNQKSVYEKEYIRKVVIDTFSEKAIILRLNEIYKKVIKS